MEFNYYMPTRVIMGRDCIIKNKDRLKELGNKALIVTGRNSAKVNGSEKDITDACRAAGINYVIFDKVKSNPTIDCVYEGAALARKKNADFIIAIGGGSPMDAGKAIALLAAQDIPAESIFSGSFGKNVLPLVLVPTTAGTGSEVTPYAILTNDKNQTKTSIASPNLFPDLAFLDAKYTESLSLETTVNTAIDALSHGIEGMISLKSTEISDGLARQSIRQIAGCFNDLETGRVTLRTREKLLYASMLAGMVISHTGTTAVHSMGYSLTYFKDVDHGRANGLLLAAFMEFTAKVRGELITGILKEMGLKNVRELKEILDKLLGKKEIVTIDEIRNFSRISVKAKNIANCPVRPVLEDIEQIYKASFGLV